MKTARPTSQTCSDLYAKCSAHMTRLSFWSTMPVKNAVLNPMRNDASGANSNKLFFAQPWEGKKTIFRA